MFLDEYPEIPYATLSYTAGECNYGGKVTDAHDRHTIMTILATYYTPELVENPSYRWGGCCQGAAADADATGCCPLPRLNGL